MTRKKKKTKMDPLCAFIVFLAVILTLTASALIFNRSILKTLYPVKYAEFVEVYSKENNLSPFFVYAVIKCESNFDKEAHSASDAYGIMQLKEETALWCAGKMGIEVSTDEIKEPETNIKKNKMFVFFKK